MKFLLMARKRAVKKRQVKNCREELGMRLFNLECQILTMASGEMNHFVRKNWGASETGLLHPNFDLNPRLIANRDSRV